MNVVELNLAEAPVRAAVLALQRRAFGTFSDDLFAHIIDQTVQRTVGYGIYEASDLVAVNCFIPHSVHRSGTTGVAYQSCMSATREDQKGKGCFSRIIDFAKADLHEKDAAFIFGFPNANSGPIFVEKLGFSLSPNISTLAFRSPFGLLGAYDGERLSEALASEVLVTFDYREAAMWKAQCADGQIFEHEALTNYLFGKVTRKKMLGLPINLLVVGGVEVNKPYQINRFFARALKAANCHALRIVSNTAGPLAQAARIRRGSDLTEPMIASSLGWEVNARDLEALGGLKDVY